MYTFRILSHDDDDAFVSFVECINLYVVRNKKKAFKCIVTKNNDDWKSIERFNRSFATFSIFDWLWFAISFISLNLPEVA